VTMRSSSTVMEIWTFEVLPGRLFQEQRSVVNRWSLVGRRSVFTDFRLLFATLRTYRTSSKKTNATEVIAGVRL